MWFLVLLLVVATIARAPLLWLAILIFLFLND